jgi:hypothetical protein
MYIIFKKPIHHWNYYLAVEDDMIKTSQYVEISFDNMATFSVEYTKIILSAASEVDVLLKQIYLSLGYKKQKPNFNDYCKSIKEKLESLITEELCLERYGISLKPFTEWEKGLEPNWHKAYNNLKHNRTENYKDANLENTLLSLSALYSTVIHYYFCSSQQKISNEKLHLMDVTESLRPRSKMIQFSKYYQPF